MEILSDKLKKLQSKEKTGTWLQKGNLKGKTEYLWKAAQSNTMITICVQAQIDKTQQDCKYGLWKERGEKFNHILSRCCWLAEKAYKIRYDSMEKVIHWEFCKRLKLDHISKWFMQKLEYVLKNDTHKLFRILR